MILRHPACLPARTLLTLCLRGACVGREDVEGDQVGSFGEDIDAVDAEEEGAARRKAWRRRLGGRLDEVRAW